MNWTGNEKGGAGLQKYCGQASGDLVEVLMFFDF